jgi:hypothetical protein
MSALAFVWAFAALIQFVGLAVGAESARVRLLALDAGMAFVCALWARLCWRFGHDR